MAPDFHKEGHVAYVTLNRPEAMNSLDPESIERLVEIWAEGVPLLCVRSYAARGSS